MATLNDWILYNYGNLPEPDRELIKTAGLDKEYSQYSGSYYNKGNEGYSRAENYLKQRYGSNYDGKNVYFQSSTLGDDIIARQLDLKNGEYQTVVDWNNQKQYTTLKDQAFKSIALNQGYKPKDYSGYYSEKFGTDFTPEQIAAATSAYNDAIWSNPAALKYKLYKSNALLGDDALAGNFQKQLVMDYANEKNYVKYDPQNAAHLTRYQKAAWDKYIRNFQGEMVPEQIRAINKRFGIDSDTSVGPQYWVNRDYESTKQWYQLPDVNAVEKIFEDRYKTASPFNSDTEIERARNIVYGEVQKPVDLGEGWKELYQTYGKWREQDKKWYQDMLQSQGIYEGAKGVRRAEMAAGGMQEGSEQWQRNLDKVDQLRFDLEQARQDKAEALRNTSVYQALEENYKSLYNTPEVRSKKQPVTKYRQELVKAGYVRPAYTDQVQRYDSETGRVYFEKREHPAQYVPPQYASVPYQDYEAKETKTGNYAYTGTDKPPGFDEFYQLNFGEMDFSNVEPVKPDKVSNQESESERKARQAAGGMYF